MTRSILTGLLGLISVVAVGSIPLACQSGGIGDPCTPEDEYNPQFPGFKLTEENIESRSFQCQTRICLVNHFQGRVSCPLGQPEPTFCSSDQVGQANPDGSGGKCVEAATIAPECDPSAKDGGKSQCAQYGGVCNKKGKFCECGGGPAPAGMEHFICDAKTHQFKSYVWHKKNNCQTADGKNTTSMDCCIPGTDTPVVQAVCGQCEGKSKRDAESAVYCSCRCGVADGQPDDPNFNFCTCPDGYECSEIRRDVGISDPQLSGKYCIKSGTGYKDDTTCGNVKGFYQSGQCKGLQSGI